MNWLGQNAMPDVTTIMFYVVSAKDQSSKKAAAQAMADYVLAAPAGACVEVWSLWSPRLGLLAGDQALLIGDECQQFGELYLLLL